MATIILQEWLCWSELQCVRSLSARLWGTATQVQLQVHDTGSGIPAEQLPHLFEPLYTTKPEGTGLGLYLMQEIVVAHGGKVMVESVVGQGTTFTLTLPRAIEQSPSEDSGDDALSDAPGGK